MGVWGQGNYSATYSSNCTLTAGTNGSSCTINVGTEGYNGIKVGTSSKGGDMSVTVPAGAKYLHIHVAAWNGVTNLSLNITPNENVAPTSVALTANSGIANNSPFTFSGDPSTSDYYKVITFTEALTSETVLTFTTSIAKRFVIWGVNSEEEGSNPPTPTCATPTFNPAAGTYTEAQTVTISCATEGATIYYTTNGDEPTTSSTVYAAPISVSSNMTIKAMAAAQGYDNSAVATAEYIFEAPSFNQDWEGTMHGWSFVSVTGDQVWSVATTSGNHYAKMSGYASSANHENEDWCISPAFDLSEYTNPVLTFKTAKNYTGNDLVVYFSNNYDGQNPTTATWQELECTLSPGGNWTFVESGNIDLSSFSGSECYIGFKYTSTTSAAATWELDDIVLASQTITPTITLTPSSIDLGNNNPTEVQISKTFTVSQSNLTEGIVLNASIGDLTTTTIAQGAEDTEITWTYTPTEAGSISATITATSTGAETQTLTITGAAVAPVTGDRYEMVTEAPQDWSGCYIITGTNSGDYYALTGVTSNLGTTAAVTVVGNSIESNSTTDGYQVIVAQTTNGYSLYMDGVGYLGYNSDATTSNNYLHALESFEANTCEWTIAMTDGLATITNVRNNVRSLQFNYNNGNSRFACYTSSQVKPTLFKYTGTVVLPPVINVTENTVSLEYYETEGSIEYTITNPVLGTNLIATSEADWIEDITVGESAVTFTATENESTEDRTATITLSYTGAVDKVITINQAAYEAPTYAELPFAFNGGKADIEGTNGLYQEGLDSDYASNNTKLKFNGTGDWLLLQFSERPGTLTFDIKGYTFSGSTFALQTSENGVDFSTLKSYTNDNFGEDVYSEEFTDLGENVRYIKWVYTNKVSGNVGLGNITLGEYVAPQPSITVETNVIDVDAESHQEFLNVNFVNFEPTTGYAFTCDANGTFTDYSWLVAELDINNNRVRYTIGNNEEVARTGYFRVKCGDVYSEIVTVNQAAYVPPFEPATYIPATEINPDKRYIIVGFIGDDAYAMGYQKTNNRHAVGISFDGTTATVETSEVYELVIANQGDYYTIYDERTPGFLYAASDEKNWLRTEEELDDDGNGLWNITFGEQGLVDLVAANTNVRNVMQFNAGSSTTDPLFACYASANQEPVYLYEKVESAEYTLEITGYTDDSEKTGYHLIASPVFVDPYLVGMADGDFDLYSFDQSEEEEWRNYEAGSFTMLEPGKGYLYAKKATDNVQTYYFNLSGTPYVGDGYIDLAYDANEGVSFPGLNLIGNPFGEEATLNIPYYRMNSIGSGLEAVNETESPVNVMEGVFVYAEYNAEYGYVTNYAQFTPNGNTSGGGGMKINLTRNRGTAIDNAIVRFDEGQQLPKFQLFENSTKLYIPQGNKDFAIVRSAAQGEMPVSFRASENGTYTIAVEAENVDMNYLHLIDNMTGADVDLLATPNYTFEARTNDYTSRFRLVFSANGIDEQTAEAFAFFNGTSWTVSNTGDATLQVVDITGRIVSSETINGNATVSLNQPAGIYMLRLVNGNDVKVQKVVVR